MVFCNKGDCIIIYDTDTVTILILIDGFLQWQSEVLNMNCNKGHNPYFNRWFSAIGDKMRRKLIIFRHNPYFNRWFSAINGCNSF